MNTIKAIQTRHAVRDWTNKRVEDGKIKKILEAGRLAPSPLNSQPWKFIVVKNKKTIEKLMQEAHHGKFLSHANVLIVVAVECKAKIDQWLTEHEQHLYGGACAIQNMWLAAHELKLGSCWITLDDKQTKKLLGIPNDYKVIGSLATGYATKKTYKTPRNDITDIVSYEKFTPKKQHTFVGKIIKITDETPNVKTFTIEKPANFTYKAGQFCILSFTDKRKVNNKKDVPMTISSSPTEKTISFTIKNMGGYTKEMFKLKKGNKIIVNGPAGITYGPEHAEMALIAGGTGIAPFLSIIKYVAESGFRNKITLFNANKTQKDIICKKYLDKINKENSNIKVINILSEEKWNGETGRINKQIIKKYVKHPTKTTWQLCGPPPMVHALKETLKQMGVSENRIKIESWEMTS